MRGKVHKWGNSLAVRIPKAFAQSAGIREAGEIELSLEGDTIRLAAAGRKWTLEDLLRSITRRNRHAEIDLARPVGKEAW
jgi:antitoxin MazE